MKTKLLSVLGCLLIVARRGHYGSFRVVSHSLSVQRCVLVRRGCVSIVHSEPQGQLETDYRRGTSECPHLRLDLQSDCADLREMGMKLGIICHMRFLAMLAVFRHDEQDDFTLKDGKAL